MTPAERLRAASAHMRQAALDGTPWSPATAAAVADWLDNEARFVDDMERAQMSSHTWLTIAPAVALAAEILGGAA